MHCTVLYSTLLYMGAGTDWKQVPGQSEATSPLACTWYTRGVPAGVFQGIRVHMERVAYGASPLLRPPSMRSPQIAIEVEQDRPVGDAPAHTAGIHAAPHRGARGGDRCWEAVQGSSNLLTPFGPVTALGVQARKPGREGRIPHLAAPLLSWRRGKEGVGEGQGSKRGAGDA